MESTRQPGNIVEELLDVLLEASAAVRYLSSAVRLPLLVLSEWKYERNSRCAGSRVEGEAFQGRRGSIRTGRRRNRARIHTIVLQKGGDSGHSIAS